MRSPFYWRLRNSATESTVDQGVPALRSTSLPHDRPFGLGRDAIPRATQYEFSSRRPCYATATLAPETTTTNPIVDLFHSITMAANDYYNLGSSNNDNPYSGRDDTSYNPHSYNSTPAPPYTTQPPAAGTDRPPKQSPFDTPFDDHVYPLDSHQQSTSSYNMGGHPEDSAAYGPSRTDDIPLRPRPPPKDVELGDDHVHDAPSSGRPTPVPKKKKGNIRLGQLGMFGSNNTKRIPWIVYIFSIVHVAVFVGEIVRNGK